MVTHNIYYMIYIGCKYTKCLSFNALKKPWPFVKAYFLHFLWNQNKNNLSFLLDQEEVYYHRFTSAYVLGMHVRSEAKKRTHWRRKTCLAGKHDFSKEKNKKATPPYPRPPPLPSGEYPQGTRNHRVCGTKDSCPLREHGVTQLFYFSENCAFNVLLAAPRKLSNSSVNSIFILIYFYQVSSLTSYEERA